MTDQPSQTPTAPKIIYLQYGPEDDEPMGDRLDYEGITWCQNQINEGDTKYIRFDEHERELSAARLDAERLRASALKLSDTLHNAEADGLELPASVDSAWSLLTVAIEAAKGGQ